MDHTSQEAWLKGPGNNRREYHRRAANPHPEHGEDERSTESTLTTSTHQNPRHGHDHGRDGAEAWNRDVRRGPSGTQHGVKGEQAPHSFPRSSRSTASDRCAPLGPRKCLVSDAEVHQGRVRGLRIDGRDVAAPPAGVWQAEDSASGATARPPLSLRLLLPSSGPDLSSSSFSSKVRFTRKQRAAESRVSLAAGCGGANEESSPDGNG